VAKGHPLQLLGEYDIARKDELRAIFAHVGESSNGDPITIDMSRVTYVDSTFLNELASMCLRRQGQPVTLVGEHPNTLRILQLAQLDRFFAFR